MFSLVSLTVFFFLFTGGSEESPLSCCFASFSALDALLRFLHLFFFAVLTVVEVSFSSSLSSNTFPAPQSGTEPSVCKVLKRLRLPTTLSCWEKTLDEKFNSWVGGGDHNTLPEPGDILTEREDPSGNGESVHSSSANMFGTAVNFG